MEFLRNIFLDIGYIDFVIMLLRLVSLSLISAIIVWLINLIIVKLNKKSSLHRDYAFPIYFLISLSVFFLVYSVYFYFLVKYTGIHNFSWGRGIFYLGILPHFLLYFGIIVLFFVKYARFFKNLNN